MKLREVYLISQSETLDEIRQPKITETKSTALFVELRSVSGVEFFNARQGGLVPEFSFIISAFDYHGESIVEYNGSRYAVYRTYEPDDDTVEVYCQVESGVTHNVEQSDG